MIRKFLGALAVLSLSFAFMGTAEAGRTPSVRSEGNKSTGARSDITVPYLTTGKNAFQAYSVAPRVYASPEVIDVRDPGARPVFNIIFYGSTLSFGTASTGPAPRSE